MSLQRQRSRSASRQPREKLNSLEPTLTLDHLLCKVLGQCSLQTCSVFPLYEVALFLMLLLPCALLDYGQCQWLHSRPISHWYDRILSYIRCASRVL